MPALSRKDKSEFIEMVERIPDDQLRYFYLMLGSAIAEHAAPQDIKVNTSPAHIAELQARLNQA
jgi:hypothetical protein